MLSFLLALALAAAPAPVANPTAGETHDHAQHEGMKDDCCKMECCKGEKTMDCCAKMQKSEAPAGEQAGEHTHDH